MFFNILLMLIRLIVLFWIRTLAEISLPSGHTWARERVDSISARRIVAARVGAALVDVNYVLHKNQNSI